MLYLPRPRTLLLAAPLCLSLGCAHYSPLPLDAKASAERLTSRRLEARTWTLRSLTEEALRHHPDLAVARAKYETAAAAVHTAGESPNPTVAVLPQIVPRDWISSTYAIDFDWTIETAGKRNKRILVALAQKQAAAANVMDTAWKVRAAVRKAYLDVYVSEQRVKLLNEAISRQGDLLRAFKERIKAGAESRSVTAQARLLQAQMRLQAAESAKLAAVARAALAEAMAMSVQGLDGATFSFAAFETTNSSFPSKMKALTRRSDILAALADYAAAEASLRLEIAKQYPDFHFNPGYQLDGGQNKWDIGIGLTLPILNHNQGGIGEALAKRKESVATFESVQAKALAEYDRAAAGLVAARTKLATTDALLDEQARQAAAEERIFKSGEGDRTALLTAQVEQAITQASRVDAVADVQAALGALEEATQTPVAE